MNYRHIIGVLTLLSLLMLLAACGSSSQQAAGNGTALSTSSRSAAAALTTPATITGPTASSTSAAITNQQQDPWMRARSALPANLPLYKPAFVPERFGPPELLEARKDPKDGLLYTIVYAAKDENLAFILNMGKGAWGNFPPAEVNEPITVLGVSGGLSISSETHAMGVFWQDHGRNYQIKGFSRQMTKEEMMRIVKSLAP
jgi:hypothetical protein